MKALVKVTAILFGVFTSILLFINYFELLTIQDIESWLEALKNTNPIVMGLCVSLILAVDIFLSIPTTAVLLLAGYVMGFKIAFFFCLLGLLSVGVSGYVVGSQFGERFLRFIEKDEEEREKLSALFLQYGVFSIILSRAAPMLPEVTACLAGLTKMKKPTFILAWVLGSVPYCAVLCYAGSMSSRSNPYPGLLAYASFVALALLTSLFIKIIKK